MAQRTADFTHNSSGSWSPVPLTAPDIRDTDDFHDPGTNGEVITVPEGLGGIYQISGRLQFLGHGGNVDQTSRGLGFGINGVEYRVQLSRVNAHSTFQFGMTSSVDFVLPEGSTVSLLAYQNTGGEVTVTSATLSVRLVSVL